MTKEANTYRPDIDGLRGVAVLLVVAFHLLRSPGFNGYLGVDIFFVVSGYLITRIVLSDLELERFQFREFFERRTRRIVPALFVVVAVSALCAYVLLTPADLAAFGKSMVAAATFVSNYSFYAETGYFEVAAEQKPLLHTWSLSVEEQFYLVCPLLVVIANKFFARYLLSLSIVAAGLSLSVSVWGQTNSPSAVFFWTPFRVWEFAMGVVVLLATDKVRSVAMRQWLSIAGLLFLVLGLAWYPTSPLADSSTRLAVCGGVGMLMLAGNSSKLPVTQLLSFRPLVFIGLISYSLYLWHWPARVFLDYYLIRPLSIIETLALFAGLLTLSTASWRYIEQPIRRRRVLHGQRAVFFSALAAAGIVIAVGTWLSVSEGAPGRFSATTNAFIDAAQTAAEARMECRSPSSTDVSAIDLCKIGLSASSPTFLVWGDSHAGRLAPAIEALTEPVSGLLATKSSCPPLLGVVLANLPVTHQCKEYNDSVLGFLKKNPDVRTVVLSARWAPYIVGTHYGVESGPSVLLADQDGRHTGQSGNAEVFRRGLERTVGELSRLKKEIWIVGSVPELGWPLPSVLSRLAMYDRHLNIAPTRDEFNSRQQSVLAAFKDLRERYPVTVLYPHEILCDDTRCRVVQGSDILYSDAHHLSTKGAQLLAPLFIALDRSGVRGPTK